MPVYVFHATMNRATLSRRGVVAAVVVVLFLASVPGVAAAETRAGGTVVVEEGETVDGLTAFAGSVVVRGTVEGKLDGLAGSVVIERGGVVTGDVETTSGSVRVSGRVDGDVRVAAGSVTVTEAAAIAGDLRVGGGSVLLEGSVGGDAVLGAPSITLASSATVGGDLRHGPNAQFENEGAAIAGSIVQDPNIDVGGFGGFAVPQVPNWLVTGYFTVVNLVLGAALLAVMPRFSRGVVERVGADPLTTGGVGLLVLVGVPVALVLLAITIVGIPITVLGAILFGLLVWVALVYGRIAIGAIALEQFGVSNRWAALLVGVVGMELVGLVPILGTFADFATVLLGLGAVVLAVRQVRRERRRLVGRQPDVRDTGEGVPPA
jgi:cytoskeletal protein CcmA (bactofilin family)